jgi:hypothetical protein
MATSHYQLTIKFRCVAKFIIVVNDGHRDFVYAARSKSLKLRYLIRLYCKELVLRNFIGLPADQLLERMVELSLRTEENLSLMTRARKAGLIGGLRRNVGWGFTITATISIHHLSTSNAPM